MINPFPLGTEIAIETWHKDTITECRAKILQFSVTNTRPQFIDFISVAIDSGKRYEFSLDTQYQGISKTVTFNKIHEDGSISRTQIRSLCFEIFYRLGN